MKSMKNLAEETNPDTFTHSNSSPKVSVNILIYNGSWNRVKATLNSVIMQKGIDFEIIVMDDCSKENHSDKIKDLFSRHNFTNYKLIVHEKNCGTIASFLEAAKESRAEYNRGLGQGDMFFDEYALRDSYNFMIENNADVMVSKTVFYLVSSNPIKIIEHSRFPQNTKAYDDPDELRDSYLLQGDRVSGAAVMYRREVFEEYMNEAVNAGMKYIEDFMIKCMVFDKKRVKFFDRNVIFYESGVGVTTGNNYKTSHKANQLSMALTMDEELNNKMLLERCIKNPSEFSKRLESDLKLQIKQGRKIMAVKKFRDKLGIASIPLIMLMNMLSRLKTMIKGSDEDKLIKTSINVPTDFGNLCVNQE